MGGLGSIFAGVFGVIWTISASAMGAPVFFTLFGVVFVLAAAAMAIYNFSNATRKNRFSAFDVTDHTEEPDPLNARFGGDTDAESAPEARPSDETAAYCPYCGAPMKEAYQFCPRCGKRAE